MLEGEEIGVGIMFSELGQYYSAALIQLAKDEDGLSIPRESLRDRLIKYTNLPVTENDVASAVRILNRCDISYTEDDQFAGQYIVITQGKYDLFLQRVSEEQVEYNRIIKNAPDENSGISRAEEAYLPYLSSYHKFAALRKYSAFGNEWLSKALRGIAEQIKDGSIGIPASDRIVLLDDNNPDVKKIRDITDELATSLDKGNDLGDISLDQAEALAAEVQGLKGSLAKSKVRSSELVHRAKQTLKWIAEKAGGTIVGELATTLYKLIMNFLGLST